MSAIVIVLIVVIVLALAGAALVAGRSRRRKQLQEQFGPEYQRAVEEHGGERGAQRALKEREERREQLDIRPLEPAERDQYAERWRATQARFVDRPEEAIGEADVLVTEVMRARGYPVDDFDQRAADVSVDHPQVVENYREAHGISQRHAQGGASTEELRRGMVHYRSLFDELLGGEGAAVGHQSAGGQPAAAPKTQGQPAQSRPTHDHEERR